MIYAEPVSFDIQAFIDILFDAHKSLQGSLYVIGPAVKGDHVGNCLAFNGHREKWIHYPIFVGAPEPWQSMHSEYRSLIEGAVQVTMPIYYVCSQGGGNVSEEDDRKIVVYLDMAQNRIYQLLKQAQAMR